MRVRSYELSTHVGEQVVVAGWLQSIRRLGKVTFVVVRDGWGTIQMVVADDARMAPIANVELESVVEVAGTVVGQPQLELHAPTFTVIAAVTTAGPVLLGKKSLANVPLPTLLDHAGVANRHPTRRAVFKLAAAAMRGFRRALDAMDFVEIQSPKLVGSATEGGANVFRLDYFGRPAYLAQSPQLYKQTMVGVFERVYEVGPVFRAEPHDTARHINQYTSLDVELGFITSHADVMRVLVEVVREMLAEITRSCAPELALLGATMPEVPASVPEIHFTDAQAMLGENEPDLSPENERTLGSWARDEHGSDFLFVVGYPMVKRPFYTHPDPDRPAHSRSFDLLFRGTELVTGGQRLHRYDDYLAAIAARGMSTEPVASYLEVFANGMPPHGGFAIGLERFVMQLLGLPNIRLATLFPRDLARLSP
jgi:nondiscriminating aspartyl-tRNA synthetase